jgi:hypothetical protein
MTFQEASEFVGKVKDIYEMELGLHIEEKICQDKRHNGANGEG